MYYRTPQIAWGPPWTDQTLPCGREGMRRPGKLQNNTPPMEGWKPDPYEMIIAGMMK